MNRLLDVLLDTVVDNLKLFPFLLVTYLILEYLEHKTADKTAALVRKAGLGGPFIGSLCGILPQCGFSVVASNFYAGRVITLGTLIAIYLSTSDEMLPILISNAAAPRLIAAIVAYKAVCGLVFGYLIDYIWRRFYTFPTVDIEQLCRNENCHCEENIWQSALYHSLRITLFIFIITLILNTLFEFFNAKEILTYLQIPLLSEAVSGLFGLIPNCSASIILTQLYLENCINTSTMLAGSLVNAGVGLLVLFRVNKHLKENIYILLLLYGCGLCGGLLWRLLF